MELFRTAAHERGAAVLVVTHDHRSLDLVHRTFVIEDGILDIGDASPQGTEPVYSGH
ncbi:MAG: ABC-type lipoprotein export system ATPase subunit [Planctomycetota bacterium]|jgi:ABC-type lipoprotein export system ATPase subunit